MLLEQPMLTRADGGEGSSLWERRLERAERSVQYPEIYGSPALTNKALFHKHSN